MPAHLIAEEGPNRGLVLNLEQGEEWIVGRDPDESIFVLEDHTVSRKHARLIRTSEGIYLENFSRITPTLINDEAFDGQVLLKEGDRVQVGQTVFLFSEKEIPHQETPSKKEGYEDVFGSLEELSGDLPTTTQAEKSETFQTTGYDTIFEAPSEEEVPFHLLAETPLILKVISGPNAGAEIGLEKDRTYIIGKDPASSDIVLQDLSVSRNHAKLLVLSDGSVEIEDLGSKNGTVVNGTPISEKTKISTQDLISLGTTIFLIVDREAPEETIYSPMVPIYEPPKAADAQLSEEHSAPKEEKKDWKKEPIPLKYLIAAASFAAIFLLISISFFSLFKSKQVEIAQKDPSSQIQKALEKFPDVQFSFNPASGKLFLVGHVLNAVETQELRYRISGLPFVFSVEDNIVIDDMVDKMMNDILSSNEMFRGVVIQSLQPGKFIVSGYVDTNAEAMQLSEYLAINFPYLDRLENRVAIGENINAEILGLLQADGFGAVTFQYANGNVILSGMYSDRMENSFQDLIKQIHAVSGVAGVKNYAVAASLNQAAIDLSGQFQVTGTTRHDGEGFAVILNGKVYILGDVVNGMAITEIDPDTILLEKDGIKYKINYTR